MSQNVHYARRPVKSKRTPNPCFLHAMMFDDRPEPAKRLETARKSRGFQDAKAAATYYGWSYDTYAQHENGTRGLTRAAKKYALAFRISEAWLLTGEGGGPDDAPHAVPVVGYVGAGGEGFLGTGSENGEIPSPHYANQKTVAVKIRGDSMGSILNGWYAVYDDVRDPPTDDLIGKVCVVWTADGKAMLKILRRGSRPGVWSLHSGIGDPIEDVDVVAAAPVRGFERG